MYDFLWLGRGGQGAFTASRLLGCAYAKVNDNHYALAFPSFGPERRGAPIKAFTKLDTKVITDRSSITHADFVIYTDDTLFDLNILSSLKEGGKVLLCTKEQIDNDKIVCLDGLSLALEYLKLPITNTVMLGAVCALFNQISLDCVFAAIDENMPKKLQQINKDVVKASFDFVKA